MIDRRAPAPHAGGGETPPPARPVARPLPRLGAAALALLLALAACAPLTPVPDVKVRTPGASGTPAATAPATPPMVVLPTITPTATATPQPNRRIGQGIELGQLVVTITRAQRFRTADRCPAESQGVEIDYRINNRSQETIGIDFIDSTILDAQGRTLRPNTIYLRETRDVLPGFSERMTYQFCILPDSSGLTLLVAPAVYRGFERQQASRAIVDLEAEGVDLPVAPRAPTAPPATPTPGR